MTIDKITPGSKREIPNIEDPEDLDIIFRGRHLEKMKYIDSMIDRLDQMSAQVSAQAKEVETNRPNTREEESKWYAKKRFLIQRMTKLRHMKYRYERIKNQYDKESEYLMASRFLTILDNECSQIMDVVRRTQTFLLRGSKGQAPAAFEGSPWTRRNAKDTSDEMQIAVDTLLSRAGFKALRSNSIFASGDMALAMSYGSIYMIFPKDGFSFTWSQQFRDFFEDYGTWVGPGEFLATPEHPEIAAFREDTYNLFSYIENRIEQIPHSSESEDRIIKKILLDRAVQVVDMVQQKNRGCYYTVENINRFISSYKSHGSRLSNYFTLSEKELGIINQLAKFKPPYFTEIVNDITPSEAKTIAEYYKFDNDNLDLAIQSGNEILINGEYYAFSYNQYRHLFNNILFGHLNYI